MKEVLIEVSNLTKTFHSGDKITKALDNVSFKLYRGETLGWSVNQAAVKQRWEDAWRDC